MSANKTILVVDDEADIQLFLRLVLGGAGYDVEVAGDGQAALEAIGREMPDLMLLDLMMPVLDGWGVLEKLEGRRPPTILVLSAAPDPDRAAAAGAAACLSKPFSVKLLLETVARLTA